MSITLFNTTTQEPSQFETGTEAKDAILSGQFNLDPNQDVYLLDDSNSIVKAKGADAVGYIISPSANYRLASDSDIQRINREKRYGTGTQQALAGAEGVINSLGLGFGNALTKTAIDLATPRGSTLAKEYGEAVKERQAENPVTSLTGDIAGLIVDPIGTVGAISKATSIGGKATAKGAAKAAEKAAPLIEKAVKSSAGQKAIERGAEFAAEGALYGATYEAGRQALDDLPYNSDAILSEAGKGALIGGSIGAPLGAAEVGASKALRTIKEQTKKNIDKITGASPAQKGETFYNSPSLSMERKKVEGYGDSKKAVVLESTPEGMKYVDQRKEGFIPEFSPNARSIDLGSPESLDSFGQNLKIKDLSDRYKYSKKEDEAFDAFLSRQKISQEMEDFNRVNRAYMEEADQRAVDIIEDLRRDFKKIEKPDFRHFDALRAAEGREKRIFDKYNTDASIKNAIEISGEANTRRALSDIDYIKNGNEILVLNGNILPKEVRFLNKGKNVVPLSFEAGQMAKQFRVTPKRMKKKGNERLNEISDFIFDHYPKEGNLFSRSMTDADHIFEQINLTKNNAINGINDSIEHALNSGNARMSITNEDIARYIDSEILPRYTDPSTGNPLAGLKREYDNIKNFSDGYRDNGFSADKYGRREYLPLNVKELRELRKNLDTIANYNKLEANALQDGARELRTWIEDEVMSRVGNTNKDLLDQYKRAKKLYGLSVEAGEIVDLAAKKAAKDSNFSLFYSGVGSALGAGLGGVGGAFAGGVIGGLAKNALSEYSGALSVFISRGLGKDISKYEKMVSNAAKSFFKPVVPTFKAINRAQVPNEQDAIKKDYDRLVKEMENRTEYIDNFISENQDLFELYPQMSEKILNTTIRARDFLISKIPQNPFIGNPWKEDQWTPSASELSKYLRYREAAESPKNIIMQIQNGYVTPEAVEVLNEVYPETRDYLLKEIIENGGNVKSLPVNKRMELYKIFGVQLDSFVSGNSFAFLQGRANVQAINSANGDTLKPQNAMKPNFKKIEPTLGESTV